MLEAEVATVKHAERNWDTAANAEKKKVNKAEKRSYDTTMDAGKG